MKIIGNYPYTAILIWLSAAIPGVFADSFDLRPSVTGQEAAVTLGTECGRALYERCQATQYGFDPAVYRVAPPDFGAPDSPGWFLDQATMAILDVKVKAVVPWYAETDTVFGGTTNISMLSVTNLWAALQIGDKTNQFTRIPAGGTNAANYGAWPWRIYAETLVERHKALNALRYTFVAAAATNSENKTGQTSTWALVESNWGSVTWSGGAGGIGPFPNAFVDDQGGGPVTVGKQRARIGFKFEGDTNLVCEATLLAHVQKAGCGNATNEFGTFEAPGSENDYLWLSGFNSPFAPGNDYVDPTLFGDSGAIYPDPGETPDGWMRGWKLEGKVLFDWQFLFCTDAL